MCVCVSCVSCATKHTIELIIIIKEYGNKWS